MIRESFHEVHTKSWKSLHIGDATHELVICRQIIPWEKILSRLRVFYKENGRYGKDLRVLVAIVILKKLRLLSDQRVIDLVQENRYAQYFCNVPDAELCHFLDRSTIVRFRQRIGVEGCQLIESLSFQRLVQSGAVVNDACLIDSSVLLNNVIHPNDVELLFKAFGKLLSWSGNRGIEPWWDHDLLKKRWRVFCLKKKQDRPRFLFEFYTLFVKASKCFQQRVHQLDEGTTKASATNWLSIFRILINQTRQKLRGVSHIENRLVSLDELDARPIVKGKAFPRCEFGTTNQMSFNRQGFMVTAEVFIGQPSDKTLYSGTLKQYIRKMKGKPPCSVTDKGYRSRHNRKLSQKLSYSFFGRSNDVPEEKQGYCRSARSATEGFIAVAKNLRGMGKSLYRGINGDRIWTALGQTAFNLKKFCQLYYDEILTEVTLQKLGFIG